MAICRSLVLHTAFDWLIYAWAPPKGGHLLDTYYMSKSGASTEFAAHIRVMSRLNALTTGLLELLAPVRRAT